MLNGNLKNWLSLVAGKRRPAKSTFRPQVEALESRWVPSANSSISGFAYVDPTGNGYAAGDFGQSGVTIALFRETGRHGERLVAFERTHSDGSYSFNKLAAGTYFVAESPRPGWVETTPTSAFYTATVTGSASSSVSGEDFANFDKPNTSVITHVSFTITDPTLGTYTVNNLRGNTHEGDTVTANFTVRGKSAVLVSLVVYDAPGATFNASTASEQVIVLDESELLSPGAHSLTVQLPDNFYQVDFALGAPITTLGPAGSNLFYSAQCRLISADNGGTQAFAPAAISGNVYNDASRSGTYTGSDATLSGVSVTLTGVNDLGQTVDVTVATNAEGDYSFAGLRAGTYTIALDAGSLPANDHEEVSTSNGSLGGDLSTAGQVSDIVVGDGQTGVNYDLPVYHSGGSIGIG